MRNSKTVNGQVTAYVVDKTQAYAQVIAEFGSNGMTQYTYGDTGLLRQTVNRNSNGNSTSRSHYLLKDALGSTKALADATGTLTDSYAYDAYGEIIASAGSTPNSYKFAGEQYDQDLGMYYNRARYYNQSIGRFSQMDSWQGSANSPITQNKYVYANANPVMYTDPSGNMAISLADFSVAQRMMGIMSVTAVSYGYSIGQELAENGSVGGGYTPTQLGWITIASMAGVGTQFYENIKEKVEKRRDQEKITLSRAHGSDELASMYSCQCYSTGYGTFEFGKQFWHSVPHAIKYGEKFILPRKKYYHVTSATISMRLYRSIPKDYTHENLDDIGNAVTVPIGMLPAFNFEMNVNGGFKLVGTFWDDGGL